MAMACDMMLVTRNVRLCLPEVNLGMNTANGGTTRLTQSARKSNSMLKCLTGGIISAQEAQNYRLASHVLASKPELMDKAFEIARKIARNSYFAAASVKRSVKNSLEVGESSAIYG